MMVDFAAVAEREHGRTPTEAILEACLVRFRPIMMTSMCALAGTLPIALGWGAGAESRRPQGMPHDGPLAVSQLLTLYITPVYYVYIEGARLRMMRRRAETLPAVPGLPPTPVHAPAEATLGLQRPIEGDGRA
jgi:HAE1 family hydrophobic/amphiphilic exporter-1